MASGSRDDGWDSSDSDSDLDLTELQHLRIRKREFRKREREQREQREQREFQQQQQQQREREFLNPITEQLEELRKLVGKLEKEEEQQREQRNYNRYLALFKGQTEKYRHIRVVFTGKEGAGKTTLCLRLRNKNVNLQLRQPTEGAVLHPVWFSINWKSKTWKHTDGQSLDEVVKARMGVLMEIMKSSGKTMEFADKAVGSTSSSDKSKYNPERRNEASAVRGASRNYGSDDAFLSLWDMGGHRSFQASHNVFLSAHGVYLLVFRLTDFLRDKLETDRLKRWIRLIGTFSKHELTAPNLRSKRIQAPPIIFVGTFLDELKKEYNDYNKQIADINRSITKFPELSSLHFVRFCTVDNSLGNDHRELHILRGFITEAAEHQDQWERELPTTWLKLELDLYQARGKGTKILTLEEVVEMNKISLAPLKDEDEVKLALEYLHSIRSVIYFREFDYVINDPQWLADFFSILITDDYFLPSYDPLLNRDLDLYKTKGELTQNLIKDLLCMKKNKAYAPFKSILLALMEKFGLIVKILLSENATENAQFSETYTLPSKLSELQNIDGITDEVNSLKHRNLAVSKTLCFVFGDIYVPYELFHRIFAKILRTYRPTSLSARSLEEAAEGGESTAETTDCLYMGFGCFEVNDICRIVLCMHAERSTIAVTVFSPTESQLPADSGKHVRLSIERILRKTLKMSNQEHFHYSHQLHCNFHLSPYDTPVQLYGVIHSERDVFCKGGECQGQHRLSRDDIEYWGITEVSTMTATLAGTALVDKNIPERRPTPRELGRLSSIVDASSCERLFIELAISSLEIKNIKEESSRLAAITQLTKMFLRWTNAYPNQTFQDIAKAMTNVNMATDRIPEVIEVNEESSCRGIVPNEVWSRAPSDDEITEIVDNIDKAFFNLCLELGLSPSVIDQHVLCHPVNFQDRMGALLRCWIKKFQRQATIGRLLTAMEVCQMDWHTTAQIWSRCQEKPTTHHRRRHRLKCSIV